MRAALLLGALTAAAAAVSHVHLALSSDPTRMFVQWTTSSSLATENTVTYGSSPSSLTHVAQGSAWTFTDSTGRNYHFHKATITGLTPGATVYYNVGGASGTSTTTSFVATRTNYTDAPLTIAWIGDLGYANAQADVFLQQEVLKGVYDHVVHVGDYAYDLDSADGQNGDNFETLIEPITSRVPYMGGEGNHENANGFAQYSHRFAVVAGDNSSSPVPASRGVLATPWNNHWMSYNVGLVHIVSISTEAFFFYPAAVAEQDAFLEADLAAVDRAVTPWVIVFGHRSIYCSCDSDCDSAATTVRSAFEELFKKHAVDLWINGHEHNNERNYPVYHSELVTGASSGKPGGNAAAPEVIRNAAAPVYIIEGCAGDSEHHEPFTRAQPAYSAFRSNTYGYGRMTVLNASALLWEQRQTDDEYPATTGTVIDAMLLVKD